MIIDDYNDTYILFRGTISVKGAGADDAGNEQIKGKNE